MKRQNIYLSPDEAAGAVLDPLDTNVNDIDTSRPKITGIHDLKCTKAEKVTSKGDHPDEYLVLTFATTKDTESVDKEKLNAGFTLPPHRINLTEFSDRATKKGSTYSNTRAQIGENIAKVAKAMKLNTSPKSIIENPAQLVGQVVPCNVSISPAKDGYEESNRLTFIVKK